jgi:plasmid stability protein
MTIVLPEELEMAVKVQANARGVSPDAYVREVLERNLPAAVETAPTPFKTSYGMLAKYGPAPSDEDIEENRAEMWKNFGEEF